jgi:hypothetical protein
MQQTEGNLGFSQVMLCSYYSEPQEKQAGAVKHVL